MIRICLFFCVFLISNGQPSIGIDRQRSNYGDIINITIRNPYKVSLYYFISMESNTFNNWGETEYDISNGEGGNTIQPKKLPPNSKAIIKYHTNCLDKNYVNKSIKYKFKLHYAYYYTASRYDTVASSIFTFN